MSEHPDSLPDHIRTAARQPGYIDGLRALADVLEEHPEMQLPFHGTASSIAIMFLGRGGSGAAAMAAASRAIPCAWNEDASEDGGEYFSLHGDLHGLKLKLATYRSARTLTADCLADDAGLPGAGRAEDPGGRPARDHQAAWMARIRS